MPLLDNRRKMQGSVDTYGKRRVQAAIDGPWRMRAGRFVNDLQHDVAALIRWSPNIGDAGLTSAWRESRDHF